MSTATSRMTAQGQTSVPAEIRRRLGLAPGSVLEWDVEDGRIVVRKATGPSFDDIHNALFPDGPPKRRTIEEMDDGIAAAVRAKARRARR
jgi:AbrB family looped-hinge helix DNA binding protein